MNVLTVVAVFTKGQPSGTTLVYLAENTAEKSAAAFLEKCVAIPNYSQYQVPSDIFGEAAWHLRGLHGGSVWNKVALQSIPLGSVCHNTQGIKTGNNAAFTVNEQTIVEKHLERKEAGC